MFNELDKYYQIATPQSLCDCSLLTDPVRLELAQDLFTCEFDDVHRKELNV